MNGKNHLVLGALLAALPGVGSTQALVTERSLSQDAARSAATVALEQCRKNGYPVTVTVLDRHARTKVVLSDDGATPHTVENSLRKAYTSLTFGVSSGDYGRSVNALAARGVILLDKVTLLEGGLPIFAGRDLVGSIGVSGASGDRDVACARAGIERISKGLGG